MLDASLAVEPSSEGFDLTLTVENAGTDTVALQFSDGQRAEFVAERTGSDGEEVWRWSEGRMFTMALGVEELPPGESVNHAATWPDPAPGEYDVRAWLATNDADVQTGSEAETVLVVE